MTMLVRERALSRVVHHLNARIQSYNEKLTRPNGLTLAFGSPDIGGDFASTLAELSALRANKRIAVPKSTETIRFHPNPLDRVILPSRKLVKPPSRKPAKPPSRKSFKYSMEL